MNRRWAGVLIAVAATVALVAFSWLWRARQRDGGGTAASPTSGSLSGAPAPAHSAVENAVTGEGPAEDADRWPAELYFPAANDRLVVEEHEIAAASDPVARATAVVATLLAARPSAPRVPVFSESVSVGKLLLLADGTLYVDLRSEAADPPSDGSTIELLRVYSIVHSVLRNVPEVTAVALLWNGAQRRSFAGHVDTSRPMRANRSLDAVRESATP